MIQIKKIFLSDKVGAWCKIPYPGHKDGCPKFDNDPACPPRSPSLQGYFDLGQRLWMVQQGFDLESHAAAMKIKMKRKGLDWSDRQCRCVLYWQKTSRKKLKEKCLTIMDRLGLDAMTLCPEGMGVNVYLTARYAGIRLERIRYLKICRHIALIGMAKTGQQKLFGPGAF